MDNSIKLQYQIFELRNIYKKISCDLKFSKTNNILTDNLNKNLENVAEQIFNLERKLYFLQQNSEDIIPD